MRKLLEVLERLVDPQDGNRGNSLVVIEHNLDILKVADWIMTPGPQAGVRGGEIVATGTPERVAATRRAFRDII